MSLFSLLAHPVDVNKFSIKNYATLMVHMKCVSLRPESYGAVCEVEELEDKDGMITVTMLERPMIPPFLSAFIAGTR
jgi:hypothetical protein